MYTKQELNSLRELQGSPVFAVQFDRRNWKFILQNESTLAPHDRREFPICYIGCVHTRYMHPYYNCRNNDGISIHVPEKLCSTDYSGMQFPIPDMNHESFKFIAAEMTEQQVERQSEACMIDDMEDAEQVVAEMNSVLVSWLLLDFDFCEKCNEYTLYNFLLWIFHDIGLFIFPMSSPLEAMEEDAKLPESTIKRIGGGPAYRPRNHKPNKHTQLNELIERQTLEHKAHIKQLAGNTAGAMIEQRKLANRKVKQDIAAKPAGNIIPVSVVADVNMATKTNDTIQQWNDADFMQVIDVNNTNYNMPAIQQIDRSTVTDTVNHRVTK